MHRVAAFLLVTDDVVQTTSIRPADGHQLHQPDCAGPRCARSTRITRIMVVVAGWSWLFTVAV